MRARWSSLPCIAMLIVAADAQTAKQKQTITFPQPANQTFSTTPLALSASASSGLPVAFETRTKNVCTVSGNRVTAVSVGNCTIRASQPGNASYGAAANVDRTFAIAKGAQTINFSALGDRVIGTAPFAVAATAASGLAVTITTLAGSVCTIAKNVVTLVATGTCTLRASQAGNANYAVAANVDRSFAAIPAQFELQYSYDSVGNVVQVRRVTVAGQP